MKIGIIGTGKDNNSIGVAIAKILTLEHLPEAIYIWNRTEEKCDWARKQILNIKKQQKVFIETPEQIAAQTNLSIICTEQNPHLREDAKAKKITTREQMLDLNLSPILQLGKKFSSYTGKVLVVTNPTDILAHAFCAAAHLDPSQVYGFNHVDAYRISRICEEYLEKKNIHGSAQAYVLGPHGSQIVPIFSQCSFNNIPLTKLLSSTELQEINQKVRYAGFVDMATWNTVAGEVASALSTSIETLFKEGKDPVCLSSYLRLSDYKEILQTAEVHNLEALLEGEDKGCFIGFPVTKNGPLPTFSLNIQEAKEFVTTYVELHKAMNKLIRENKISEIKANKVHIPTIDVPVPAEVRKYPHLVEVNEKYPLLSPGKVVKHTAEVVVSKEANIFPDVYCLDTKRRLFLVHAEEENLGSISNFGIGRSRALCRYEGKLYFSTEEGIICCSENERGNRINGTYYRNRKLKIFSNRTINSIEVTKDEIFGSHSELGLFYWRRIDSQLEKKREGSFTQFIQNGVATPTRAVLCDQGRIYVGSGNRIYTSDNSEEDFKELKKEQQQTQRVVDALLVDFINAIAATQCLDYGLYTKDLTEGKKVLHHDDPPCTARLKNGFCPKCKLRPDMQSTCLYLYCLACDRRLKNMKCPKCGQTYNLSS